MFPEGFFFSDIPEDVIDKVQGSPPTLAALVSTVKVKVHLACLGGSVGCTPTGDQRLRVRFLLIF